MLPVALLPTTMLPVALLPTTMLPVALLPTTMLPVALLPTTTPTPLRLLINLVTLTPLLTVMVAGVVAGVVVVVVVVVESLIMEIPEHRSVCRSPVPVPEANSLQSCAPCGLTSLPGEYDEAFIRTHLG